MAAERALCHTACDAGRADEDRIALAYICSQQFELSRRGHDCGQNSAGNANMAATIRSRAGSGATINSRP